MKTLPAHESATRVIRQSGSPGSLHVFELSHERAADKKLILLAEIEVSDKDNEGIIEAVAREVEQQFFNAPTKETEYAFENALAKANLRVKDILLVKPKNWLNRIHIVVLALAGAEVYLASVGLVHAFLAHREKIVDILKAPGGSWQSPNPVKLFTNIVTGKLGPDTALILTNESVLDYLSVERIRKCAQEFDAPEAIEALTELLARAPANKQFGLAVISPAVLRAPEAPRRTAARATITTARRKPYAVAEPLPERSAFSPDVDEEPDMYEAEPVPAGRFEAGGLTFRSFLAKATPVLLSAMTALLWLLAKLLEGMARLIRRLAPALASFAKAALATARNTDTRTYFLRRIRNAAGNMAYRVTHAQSRKRQLASLTVVVLLAVFVVSISVRALNRNRENADAMFQAGIAGVEQKMGEAEASLIYGNKIKSQALLAEALSTLAELAREFPEQDARLAAARDSITMLQNRAEKKQTITDIRSIATIIPAPLGPNETGLLGLGESLFFYDGVAEKIASIDVQNKLLLSLALAREGMASFNTAIALSDTEIAALSRDTALLVDTSRETVARQQFPFDPATAKPFASYNRNLYTFDPATNEIVRYRRAGSGFTSPQNWLAEEYELATMQDISVDGFVYLIDSQGTIHVFLRGGLNKTIPWPGKELPGSVVRLYTREDLDVFYVLDPAYERILRITKDGSLDVQLTAPVLQKATDLVADAKKENLYVLAADKIYQIPITSR